VIYITKLSDPKEERGCAARLDLVGMVKGADFRATILHQ
jgi:hypothetical protein